MTAATTITVSVPGSVWYDALDPNASTMEAELDLPRSHTVKRGKGFSVVYEGVDLAIAEELAEYIGDRGATLLGQGVDDPYDPSEKAARDTLRSAIKTAERIRAAIREETR